MKDKITWEDAHLFDYINEIEYLYVSDVEDYKYNINISRGGQASENARKIETPVFGYSEIVTIFKDRYNNCKLHKSCRRSVKRFGIGSREILVPIPFCSRLLQQFILRW